ncbi:8912_t:CDS:1 [Racocetra persica]|uniref:8912_t:CDS:1 n=1 Tax=Racocetra persica TaxID=160502 RepID=A0ACA9M735_9GLOM|nr:8912_t:CDS:1 [Racocetra persica]
MVLHELENRVNKSIAEIFHFVAGNSTGSIIALGLTVSERDNKSKPKFKPKDLVELYEKKRYEIFERTFLSHIPHINFLTDLFKDKYGVDKFEKLLYDKFSYEDPSNKNTKVPCKFRDIVNNVNVLIPSYNITTKEEVFFNNFLKHDSPDYTDYAIADVVRASTAAPTYFPAKQIIENKRPNNYIDGGIFMNNPVFEIYLKAKQDEHDANVEYVVCSLGTGIFKGETFNSLADKGELKWAAPLVSLMMDASCELAENNFKEFVNPTHNNKAKIIKDADYYRIQATLKKEIPLDAVDDQSIEYLKEAAKEAIGGKHFDDLVNKIKKYKPWEQSS